MEGNSPSFAHSLTEEHRKAVRERENSGWKEEEELGDGEARICEDLVPLLACLVVCE